MPHDLSGRLRTDADEIEACGGGNEAATMREAADALDTMKAELAAKDEALVEAAIPLEALKLSGTLSKLSQEMQDGVESALSCTRAALDKPA